MWKMCHFFDKMLSPCFYLQINEYMTSLYAIQKWQIAGIRNKNLMTFLCFWLCSHPLTFRQSALTILITMLFDVSPNITYDFCVSLHHLFNGHDLKGNCLWVKNIFPEIFNMRTVEIPLCLMKIRKYPIEKLTSSILLHEMLVCGVFPDHKFWISLKFWISPAFEFH